MTIYYTTGHIEKAWALPKGSVRRDIHRGKVTADKSGNQWLIEHNHAENIYGLRPLTWFYCYDDDPAAMLFMVDDSDLETEWQHMMAAFHPEPFLSLAEFRDACKYIEVADVASDDNLQHELRYYRDTLHPALERVVAPFID
jgi:hypothetical protein